MGTFAFDVGETLVDETRLWARHAERIGVPTFTFFAVFGALIEQGRPHRDVFGEFGVDVETYLAQVHEARDPEDGLQRGDLYRDVSPVLRALVGQGHRVGLAANQPERAAAELEAMGLPISFLATSAGWGVSKPDPEFFLRLVNEAGAPPASITYVGDRLDLDVIPANEAGMTSVLIRRGPWGVVHASRPEANVADRVIDSLDELLA